MSRYDVNAANTNREVKFLIEAANAADLDDGIFAALKGDATSYPHYGALATTPTANQELAQLRVSLVVRALTAYTIPVRVAVVDDSAGTGVGSALAISFEVDEQGEFFLQAWTGDTSTAKHTSADLTDTLGTGGMTTVKTKPGLQSLLDSLATVSYDGGTTGPFGQLSSTGAVVLPNGLTSSSAPVLSNAATGVAADVSGLTVTFVG